MNSTIPASRFPEPTVASGQNKTASGRSPGFRALFAALVVLVLSARTAPQNQPSTQDWQTVAPQTIGLVPASLQDLDRDIARRRFGLLDSVTFIRCGKIGYERSFPRDYGHLYGKLVQKEGPLNHDPASEYNCFNPEFHPFYRGSDLHTMQSVTKSITSVVIGVAIMRGDFPGDLDTPAVKFFTDRKIANLADRKRRITLRHLLTMTSGLEWHEATHRPEKLS
jgi:CubicO group peptidase (beta-lactamase class C family)